MDYGRGSEERCTLTPLYAEQTDEHIHAAWDAQRLIVVEPVERDDHETAQQGADETVEAVFEAFMDMRAGCVCRADAGEARVAVRQQVHINQGNHQTGDTGLDETHTYFWEVRIALLFGSGLQFRHRRSSFL